MAFKIGCYLAGFALLVLGAQQLHRSASDQRVSLYPLFNSDTLFCAAVYEDLIVDGYSWNGWRCSAATVIYPDCIIYFGARALTSSTAPAMVLSTCITFVLTLAAFFFLLRTLIPPEQRPYQTMILMGLGAIFLLINAKGGLKSPFFRMPLTVTFHSGELLCVVFDLALVSYLINAGERQRLALAGVFANTALCMLSDRLILIHFVVPTIATLVAIRLLLGSQGENLSLRRIGAIAVVLISATTTGRVLLRTIQPTWEDKINVYPFEMEHAIQGLWAVLEKCRQQIAVRERLHIMAALWLLFSSSIVLTALARRIRSVVSGDRLPMTHRGLLLVSVFYLAMTASTLGAVCYAGALYRPPHLTDVEWMGGSRYFIPVLVIPFFAIGIWLVRLPALANPMAATIVVVLGLNLAHQASKIPRADDQGVWHHYPPEVQQLDAIAKQHGLKYGLAGFWESKRLTLFSRNGLRVHPIIEQPVSVNGFIPFHWLSNARWYFDAPRGGGEPRYQFIVVKESSIPSASRARTIETFGKPAAAIPLGPQRVFIYNRPEDKRFREAVAHDSFFLREKFRFQINEAIRFPAKTLPAPLFGLHPPSERIAIEGCLPAGLLSCGPCLSMREKGRYRITIATSSSVDDDPNGRWEIVMTMPHNREQYVVANGPLTQGPLAITEHEINIHDKHLGEILECRVRFEGWGVLEMDYVEVKRLK